MKLEFTQDDWEKCKEKAENDEDNPQWFMPFYAAKEAYLMGVQAGLLAALEAVENENLRHMQANAKEHAKHVTNLLTTKQDCKHEGTVEWRNQYYSGGYDYRARTERWNECRVCGAASEKTIEYGGFE